MKQIIDYFDRCYIINLLDRTDRRRQVIKEFRRVGIDIPSERVKFHTAIRPADKGAFTDIGTRGCFISHRNVLEAAQSDRLRNVLVFEDDVSFRKVDRGFVDELIQELSKKSWDVVLFGYARPFDREDLSGPLALWPNDILGLHFYAVNGPFIGKMLQYMKECERRPRGHPDGGPMPADGAYNHVRYVNKDVTLLLSVPSLAFQRSSRTDIASTHVFDRVACLSPIIRGVRSIKHWIKAELDGIRLRQRMRQK
jgi:GR25 family glycosyltransferase involved in LPS biosynthesis